MWRVVLRSRGAAAMGLVFDRLEMPPGAELYVHGAGETRGAYTQAVNGKPDGTFSTWPLDGDALVLEYWEPADASLAHFDSAGRRYMSGFKAGVQGPDSAVLDGADPAPDAQGRTTHSFVDVRDPAVLHGADPAPNAQRMSTPGPVGVLVVGGVTAEYGKQRFGYGASQDCHHDVACVSELPARVQGALKAAKHAVVLLRSARGAHYCTGTLVNAADESRVYVLTAAHCVPPAGARGMSEWLVALHYRHTRCDKELRANDVAEFPVEAEYAEELSDSSSTSDDDAGVNGQLNDWNDRSGIREADKTLLSTTTQTTTHIGMHVKHEAEDGLAAAHSLQNLASTADSADLPSMPEWEKIDAVFWRLYRNPAVKTALEQALFASLFLFMRQEKDATDLDRVNQYAHFFQSVIRCLQEFIPCLEDSKSRIEQAGLEGMERDPKEEKDPRDVKNPMVLPTESS